GGFAGDDCDLDGIDDGACRGSGGAPKANWGRRPAAFDANVARTEPLCQRKKARRGIGKLADLTSRGCLRVNARLHGTLQQGLMPSVAGMGTSIFARIGAGSEPYTISPVTLQIEMRRPIERP